MSLIAAVLAGGALGVHHALDTGFSRYLKGTAAVFGIGIGLLLLFEWFTGIIVF